MNRSWRFWFPITKTSVGRGLITLGLLSIVSFVLTVTVFEPYFQRLDAQQVVTNAAVTSSGLGLLAFSTSLSTSVVQVGSAGAHSIYGYGAYGPAAGCVVQMFDQWPASSVTVGTTISAWAPTTFGSSSANPYVVSTIPVYTTSSALQIAATTAQNGSTACNGNALVTILYK